MSAPALSNCHFLGAQLAFWFYYATAHAIPHRNQLLGLLLLSPNPTTIWCVIIYICIDYCYKIAHVQKLHIIVHQLPFQAHKKFV